MANVLNEFGRNTAGAVVETVIVGPTAVPSTIRGLVTDFSATMGNPGANGVFRLQVSDDNFVANIWTIDQQVMPTPGVMLKTYDSILEFASSTSFRVTFVQSAASEVTVTVTGQTQNNDLTNPQAANIKETWLNGVGTTLP
jgi:hypothetical protein